MTCRLTGRAVGFYVFQLGEAEGNRRPGGCRASVPSRVHGVGTSSGPPLRPSIGQPSKSDEPISSLLKERRLSMYCRAKSAQMNCGRICHCGAPTVSPSQIVNPPSAMKNERRRWKVPPSRLWQSDTDFPDWPLSALVGRRILTGRRARKCATSVSPHQLVLVVISTSSRSGSRIQGRHHT